MLVGIFHLLYNRPRLTKLKETLFMNTVKQEIELLLKNLPEDCSLEDIQYHLYVIEKYRQGITIADSERRLTQEEAEGLVSKWVIK
ncbi:MULTISPECIES: hypothetical protein [Oscillatoriales]|uniref:Threonyl-tRNA synthetase n=5 Tax=Limnospira TaxID=2596745 RepID=A0A9P1KDY3_9CYAN|nr:MULTISPECIES: hypothetical protein [Oscillatoriales]EKD05943.1 hypothetical protein SPLC1_S550020 [Arthrospira platensis C1]MDF2207478.1 hypothetical protein [Arthrospira platensis NCB002]MDT9185187.1 hypothetical protein [Limnospira sp. PMC 289.06]MDT9196000.1 hypothetical protein [Limnospira sp. PMC 1245.20]MDT9216500.1 hypothetical protein [Limnospira sp. PMC 1256.20]MDT9231712.1 hypothetical protein [Limnospira sp. PMC 1242.20]MDT9272489.1 hypothetical protein [Limnospira sp. PMC 1234